MAPLSDGQLALEGGGLARDPRDPRGLPHPSGPHDAGRFAAFPRELQPGDRMLLPHPFRDRPDFVWAAIVARAKRRRRRKGGYTVETRCRIGLQFDADELIVIERPGAAAAIEEARRIEGRRASIRAELEEDR